MLRGNLLAATLAFASIISPASAKDDYPQRPVTLVIPFAPGGSTDILGRLLAEEMSKRLGQPVIVENKAGAAGNIGGSYVARAKPDGYTLMVAAAGPTVINPSLYQNMQFSPVTDLAPITALTREHNVMAVNAATPINTLEEFIAYAKEKPVTFGSPGTGTPSHLSGELFNHMQGLDMTHVAYKGSGPAVVDLLAGHITVMIDNMPPLMAYIQSGALRPIAVPSPERSAALPDTPTFKEAGVDDFSVMAWKGLMAPAGTPDSIIQKLYSVSTDILATPAMQARLTELGAEPHGNTPEEFAQQIKDETQWWAELIERTGTTLN
ncbi:Bug family tripartite tricarboxylate transporter substrate binding protein [Alcaligenes endophyticus]|uniref:Tripartite tricarboxylate transporter substrate binding protein n=1 Tax=Alcaligenes endophyticus TaxID=1929088 RepID=A0ABT8EJC5_9BURK|nr:tripartite tricarboxylate transporter substrate binding protein [Alcaligenes endophyticus]MCX5591615.1 tripartite tricarboxylate transporter substrate binding protein [Alcaligenes endophyticus]MDN4121292.1 tripartite tricarboxylate transporter substrate binding protein [Alcaligenes endophyticus]